MAGKKSGTLIVPSKITLEWLQTSSDPVALVWQHIHAQPGCVHPWKGDELQGSLPQYNERSIYQMFTRLRRWGWVDSGAWVGGKSGGKSCFAHTECQLSPDFDERRIAKAKRLTTAIQWAQSLSERCFESRTADPGSALLLIRRIEGEAKSIRKLLGSIREQETKR